MIRGAFFPNAAGAIVEKRSFVRGLKALGIAAGARPAAGQREVGERSTAHSTWQAWALSWA